MQAREETKKTPAILQPKAKARPWDHGRTAVLCAAGALGHVAGRPDAEAGGACCARHVVSNVFPFTLMSQAEATAAASPPSSRCRAREEDGRARRGCALTSEAADALYDAESFCLESLRNKRTNGEDDDIMAMLEDMDPEVTDVWPPTTGKHAPEHFANTSRYLACAGEPFYRAPTSFRQDFKRVLEILWTEGMTSQEEIVARMSACRRGPRLNVATASCMYRTAETVWCKLRRFPRRAGRGRQGRV